MKNYLFNRYQYVRVIKSVSNTRDEYEGIPQGSILVPLLFIININDMLNLIPNIYA